MAALGRASRRKPKRGVPVDYETYVRVGKLHDEALALGKSLYKTVTAAENVSRSTAVRYIKGARERDLISV